MVPGAEGGKERPLFGAFKFLFYKMKKSPGDG